MGWWSGPTILLFGACHAGGAAAPERTNATVTFHVSSKDQTLDRPVLACLVAGRPDGQLIQNGGGEGAIDGCKEFPTGTRAADIVAYYAALLSRHGWTDGRDFVAAGNSLHFYGISQLGGGSGNPQLGVHGATDSAGIPYRELAPAPR